MIPMVELYSFSVGSGNCYNISLFLTVAPLTLEAFLYACTKVDFSGNYSFSALAIDCCVNALMPRVLATKFIDLHCNPHN